jgi:hypothetical protein
MQKISTIVLYILAAISVALALWFFVGPRFQVGDVEVPVAYDENLLWAGILLGLTILITIIFGIEYIITHPKSIKGALITLVSAGALLGISYVFASGDPIPNATNDAVKFSTELTRKWVEVGVISMYILGGLAVAAMVFSEIIRAFR